MSTPEKDFVDEEFDEDDAWEEMQDDDEGQEMMIEFKLDDDLYWRQGYCFAALENRHTRVVYNARNTSGTEGEAYLQLLKKSAGVYGLRFSFKPEERGKRILCTIDCVGLNRVQMLYILTLFRLVEEFVDVIKHPLMKEATENNLIKVLVNIGVSRDMGWNNHFISGPRITEEVKTKRISSVERAIDLAAKAKSIFEATSLVFSERKDHA